MNKTSMTHGTIYFTLKSMNPIYWMVRSLGGNFRNEYIFYLMINLLTILSMSVFSEKIYDLCATCSEQPFNKCTMGKIR